MKFEKEILLFLLLLAIVPFVSSAYQTSQGDVAYIYNRESRIDQNIIDYFNDYGLSVDTISESQIRFTDFSQYKFIYVGDERFDNPYSIPVGNYPTIVSNYYHGGDWGFTDYDGVSQLTSNSPLKVNKEGQIIQVYTQAFYQPGNTLAIPYYYISNENELPGFDEVAYAYNRNGENLGAVIAYGSPGFRFTNGRMIQDNVCFFGLETIKENKKSSNFWTPQAEDMFEDCIGFVLAECSSDAQCNDGDEHTSDSCLNPGTPESYCSNEPIVCLNDAECGTDGFVGGLYCTNDDVYQDYEDYTCLNAGTVGSSCSVDVSPTLVEQCSDVCVAGECVGIECYDDNDCDDSNDHTSDSCLNPGTPESYCSNEPIVCLNDAECGTDGFVGGLYCTNDDVYQDYEDYTCLNAGTVGSSCSVDVSPTLVEQCSDVCVAGECVGIECYDDNDCDDSNDHTSDSCLNPGTPESQCNYEDIACLNDGECSGEVVSEYYCVSDDRWLNTSAPICLNDGSVDSYCSVDMTSQFVESCSFGCSDGVCLEGVHDVKLDSSYGVSGIGLIDLRDDSLVGANDELVCDGRYQVIVNSVNVGDFVENITLKGLTKTGELTFDLPSVQNLRPGDSKGRRANIIFNLSEGNYDLRVWALNSKDLNRENNLVSRQIMVSCPSLPIECSSDAECNDNNDYTSDSCLNPGTPESYCSNTPVECISDNDCSDDVYSQQCSGENVNITEIDYFCDAGTCNSEITNSNIVCEFGCDENENMCIGVICSEDNQCGEDGFIGEEFCGFGNGGLPETFAPSIGYSQGLTTERVVVINESGSIFYSFDGLNFQERSRDTLEANGLPKSFKPILGFYSELNDDPRVILWDANGQAYYYLKSNARWNKLTEAEKVAGGLPANYKPIVAYTRNFGGITKVTLVDGNGIYYGRQDGGTWHETTQTAQDWNLPAGEGPILAYSFEMNTGSKGVHIWFNDNGNPKVMEWLYESANGNSGTNSYSVKTSELKRLPNGMPDSAYFDNVRKRVVLWYGDEAYESANARGFTKLEGNNVYQNYQTFSCNDSGQSEAYCSNEISAVVVEECLGQCSNGGCIEITCYNDNQCDDNNPRTNDVCINPGTEDSSCDNQPIQTICGNGIVEFGEQCDDGNNVDGDGCTSQCVEETCTELCQNTNFDFDVVIDRTWTMGLLTHPFGPPRMIVAQILAESFVDAVMLSDPTAEVAVSGFDTEYYTFAGLGGYLHRIYLKQTIVQIIPGGLATYYSPAIRGSAYKLSSEGRVGSEKVTILITDGGAIDKAYKIDEAVQYANDVGVTIYTIGIGDLSIEDETVLRNIAQETGGKYYRADSIAAATEIYQTLGETCQVICEA